MFKKNKMIYWNSNVGEDVLRNFGFNEKGFCVIEVFPSITLNISKEEDLLEIDILDENFLQPYDYQYILYKNPENMVAKEVKDNVDNILYKAQSMGIIRGFSNSNYLYSKYDKAICYD